MLTGGARSLTEHGKRHHIAWYGRGINRELVLNC